jgi:hypothetical protein
MFEVYLAELPFELRYVEVMAFRTPLNTDLAERFPKVAKHQRMSFEGLVLCHT